jgi:hypothetical protein
MGIILGSMENAGHDSFQADPELVLRLHDAYGLEESMAERIVEDVLLAYADTVEEWVRSRHIRLQRQGLGNETIYRTIAGELNGRRFAAEPLSIRQIRRLIYG